MDTRPLSSSKAQGGHTTATGKHRQVSPQFYIYYNSMFRIYSIILHFRERFVFSSLLHFHSFLPLVIFFSPIVFIVFLHIYLSFLLSFFPLFNFLIVILASRSSPSVLMIPLISHISVASLILSSSHTLENYSYEAQPRQVWSECPDCSFTCDSAGVCDKNYAKQLTYSEATVTTAAGLFNSRELEWAEWFVWCVCIAKAPVTQETFSRESDISSRKQFLEQ